MKNWDEQIEFPKKEPEIEYAYILKSNDKPIKCTREELLEIIENSEDVKFVATPYNDNFILPGSDFETLQPVLRRKKSSVKNSLHFGLLYFVLFGGLMLSFSLTSDGGFWSNRSGKLNLLVFGLIPVLNGLFELFYLHRINELNYFRESSEIKFDFWINQKRVVSIFIVAGILVLITLVQFISGIENSVESAGLVKSKTLAGEYWRLLTCTLLHGSLLHIFFNATAIYVIGRMVIRIAGFSFFAIVFLFSGLLGSFFSLILLPNVTSVGSSGGIMGLIGFILVISLKLRDNIPRNIIKSMLNAIILTAIIGISATEIIDNAAHGGGLIGGMIAGTIMFRRKNNMIPYKPTFLINGLGILSVFILLGGIVMIFIQLR